MEKGHSRAVFLNCDNRPFAHESQFDELFLDFCGTDQLPKYPEQTGEITAYRLTLNTKYYSAEVSLCKLSELRVDCKSLWEAVDVLILFFGGDDLHQLEPSSLLIDRWSPKTLILVCQRLIHDEPKRSEIVSWCIGKGFEIVELDPDEEFREDAAQCGEAIGIARIQQILEAHPWPNMQMKERFPEKEHLKRIAQDTEAIASAQSDDVLKQEFMEKATISGAERSEKRCGTAERLLAEDEERMLAGCLDPGGASFEELFAKFAALKQSAETMPGQERKAHAEKVTLAFWRAVGGDEAEIDGLSNGDELY